MILALTLFAGTAEAARGPKLVATGATVQITAVGRKDAFWRFREELVGLVCVVGEPGLVRHSGKWYGGELSCGDGQPYYFYQVAVEVGDFPAPPVTAAPDLGGGLGDGVSAEALLAELGGGPPPAAPPAVPPAPPTAALASEWPVGARGRIRAVSSADATYAAKPSVTGMTCTVTDEALRPSGEGWFSGALRCDGRGDWFFFQVALDPLPGSTAGASATPSRKADGRLAGEPVAPGRLVRIVDLSSADLHHKDRAALVGKQCSVVEAPLLPTGEGWYAGRLFCGADAEKQFYQVAVAPN